MSDRAGIFAGDDPIALAKSWLAEAEAREVNDANAMSLATVDADGLPNVRIVLLKDIEADAFVFYTNYESQKAEEIAYSGTAAFVLHWKSLRRQIRVRGRVEKEDGPKADAYYASRPLESRIGAWASAQSRPLAVRSDLEAEVARTAEIHGESPARPPFWGGFRIFPAQIEFWADGAHRLHDRFQWRKSREGEMWTVTRLNP